MINLYSISQTAVADATVTWANKAVQRGISATLGSDNQTIYLNSPGVYEVSVHGHGLTTAAGEFGFQLVGDGTDIARAASFMDTGIGEVGAVAFDTLIAVNSTAGPTNKAALTLRYTGDAGTINLVSLVVKKVA